MRSAMRASGVVVLTVLSFVVAATPARAQTVPSDDPFLKVPILTTGAAAPGSTVSTENHTNSTTFLPNAPALALDNSFPGYPVIVALRLAGFTEQGFAFSTIAIQNANGSFGTVGQAVTGQR